MNPIVFALRRPITVMVLVVAVALGQRPGRDADADRHLPQPEPAGHLRRPALRRHGPGADGRACSPTTTSITSSTSTASTTSRAENIQGMALMKLYFHPGTNMAQAMAETIGYVNRSRAFMPPGTVLAVHHALRHRQRAGRLPGALQRDQDRSARSRTRRCSRSGRCSPACRASRRRRRSAATSGPSSSASIPTGCGPTRCRPTR